MTPNPKREHRRFRGLWITMVDRITSLEIANYRAYVRTQRLLHEVKVAQARERFAMGKVKELTRLVDRLLR